MVRLRRVFPRNSQNTQKLLAENSLPQISQIFTEVGGYGIPAIPTPPSEFLPQNPLQVCLRKSSHRFHRCAQKLCLHRVLPRNSRNSQKFQAEDILPQIAQDTQKLLAENSLPQISQIFTEVGGYGIPAIPTPPSEFLPQNPLQVCLRKSSHRFHRCAQKLCLHRVLPRNSRNSQKFQAEDILPQIAQDTQKLLAENSLPQMRTDAHRWLGCVGFSHGFHRCTQIFLPHLSFLCSVNSVGRYFCGCVGMAGMPYPPNL